MALTVAQLLPALGAGGVERGTLEVARALVRHGHRAIVVSAGGRLVAALEQAGAEHRVLDIGRKSPATLRHVPALRALLRAERVDIVHARSRLPAWIGRCALAGFGGAARPHFLTTVHGPYSVNPYSAIMLRGERVIAISSFIRDYILEHWPRTDPARIRLIPRGVDAAEFPRGYQPASEWRARWQAEFPELAGRELVTLPARVTRWKGQAEFLQLLARLRAERPALHGLIAGGADARREPFLRELRQRARAAGLEHAVTFTGARADLREIMSISRVVLSLPNEPEAFGRTALEALSLGVPVVAWDHGGASEVLGALLPRGLVRYGDFAGAVERVIEFIDRPPAIAAAHPFTLARMLEATLAVYAELSAAGHSPGV